MRSKDIPRMQTKQKQGDAYKRARPGRSSECPLGVLGGSLEAQWDQMIRWPTIFQNWQGTSPQGKHNIHQRVNKQERHTVTRLENTKDKERIPERRGQNAHLPLNKMGEPEVTGITASGC